MNKKNKTRLANAVVLALVIGGLGWIASLFIHFGVAYTDNAQVYRDIVPLNSRISGFIKEVRVEEFQRVKKGDTLLVIDDAEYRLQLSQAEANYRNALAAQSVMETALLTMHNDVLASDAGLQEAKIRLRNAQSEYQRYKELLSSHSTTAQQYDAVNTQYEAQKAQYERLLRQHASTELAESQQLQRLKQQEAVISVAQSALELARLNLSYTVILSPCDGYTSRKNIDRGELVQTGRNLLSVVSEEDCWVIANFRERQLKDLKVGSKVQVEIDAIPHVGYMAQVASISKAAGSQYSLVPQDNSIGNFVKVEQRIPVKIVFSQENSRKEMEQLGAGMNVLCKVIND